MNSDPPADDTDDTESLRRSQEAAEIAFFDQFYAKQVYNPLGWRLRLRRELKSLRRASNARPLGRVLSIACGDGQFEILLSPHAASVTCLDISPEAIRLARENARQAGTTNIEFHCLSVNDLAWAEQFDTIVCLAFLHHVPEPEVDPFLKSVTGHLTPGGLFYSQDPNVRGFLRYLGRKTMGDRCDNYHSSDERELDPRLLRQQLANAGLESIDVRPIDVTLIPATFILHNKISWPLHVCRAVDWLWCHSPLGPFASGFYAAARKPLTTR